jgi:hypothetical protein
VNEIETSSIKGKGTVPLLGGAELLPKNKKEKVMKKFVNSLVAILFVAAVSAPVFADQTKMSATPVAKTMKRKGTHTHKKKKNRKTPMKQKSTPTTK